jgi:hypothetical protein
LSLSAVKTVLVHHAPGLGHDPVGDDVPDPTDETVVCDLPHDGVGQVDPGC